jgi:hypothetical protein
MRDTKIEKGSQALEPLALSTYLSLLLSIPFLSCSRSWSLLVPAAYLPWALALTPLTMNSPHNISISFATAKAQARCRDQT